MATHPETLKHASGRLMRLDTTRALLCFEPHGRPAGFDKALASFDLVREDAPTDGKPRRGVNQTRRFCFVRSAKRQSIDPASLDKLLALLGKKGGGARLAWIGPVYRFTADPSDAGLMGVVLDALVVTPRGTLDSRQGRALANHIKRSGLTPHAKRSKQIEPSLYLRSTDLKKRNAIQASEAFTELSKLVASHPDYVPLMSPACAIPSDTHWGLQWNMTQIGAPAAWDITKGDPSVYVCVVDSGIERGHEELNRATSFGYEASSPDESSGLTPPASDPSAPSGTTALDAHGTAIASIAAGSWDAGGVAGLAGDASLFALAAPNWSPAEIQAAITRAAGATPSTADKRVLLLGGTTNIMDTPGVRGAIDAALAAGMIVVCPSGNADSNTIPYPGDGVHPDVIVCGSTDQSDTRYVSNYGATLTVVAPGKDVPVADLTGAAGFGAGDYHLLFEGSSAGAAHVAGLAALLRSASGLSFSDYPPAAASLPRKIRNVIERTAEKVGPAVYDTAINSRSDQMGFGRIRTDRALDFADVMIRDDPTDTGVEPSTGVFWRDSDVVIRQLNELQPVVETNFDAWHGNPLDSTRIYANASGNPCYAYVRVRNLGPATARNVRVRAVGAACATGFMYPTDWAAGDDVNHFVMTPLPWSGDPAAVGDEYVVGTLNAGQSKIVRFEISKAKADKGLAWPGSHVCGLARVTADNDYAFSMFAPAVPVGGEQARRNNLCQRNLHVVTAASPWFFPFLAGNVADMDPALELVVEASRLPAGALLRLGLDDPARAAPNLDVLALGAPAVKAADHGGSSCASAVLLDRARVALSCGGPLGVVTLPPGTRFDCNGSERGELQVAGGHVVLDGGKRVVESREKRTRVRMTKAPGQVLALYLEIPVPPGTDKNERFFVDIVQKNTRGEVVGGLSLFLVP